MLHYLLGARGSKASTLHANAESSLSLAQHEVHASKVVLSQLLPVNAVDALLAEAEDLGGGLIHVESDVLGACEDGALDLLPVDEGVALISEKAQQALESSLLSNGENDIIMV